MESCDVPCIHTWLMCMYNMCMHVGGILWCDACVMGVYNVMHTCMWMAHMIYAHVVVRCIVWLHVDVIGVHMMCVHIYDRCVYNMMCICMWLMFVLGCAHVYDVWYDINIHVYTRVLYKVLTHMMCVYECGWHVCYAIHTHVIGVCVCNMCLLFIISCLMSYNKVSCHLFSWEFGPGILVKYYHFFTYNIN